MSLTALSSFIPSNPPTTNDSNHPNGNAAEPPTNRPHAANGAPIPQPGAQPPGPPSVASTTSTSLVNATAAPSHVGTPPSMHGYPGPHPHPNSQQQLQQPLVVSGPGSLCATVPRFARHPPIEAVVFGWGVSEDGQLGLDTTKDVTQPKVVESLLGVQFMGRSFGRTPLVAGSRNTLAIDASGQVWSFGWNDRGTLGHGHRNKEGKPQRVAALKGIRVVQVAIGGWHCLALTDRGTMFAWGGNEYGQCALEAGLTGRDIVEPLPVDLGLANRVRAVACGGMHSLALLEDGTVWQWGENWGDFSMHPVRTPRPVPGAVAIAAVCCGAFHNLALTAGGRVLTWGMNDYGQLGNGSTTYSTAPRPVLDMDNVVVADIAAGGWHSCALSSAGEVYVWGRGEYGRLGLGDRSGSSKLRPHKVRGLESHVVVQVSAGGTHTMALTSTARLFIWGRGAFGRLGMSEDKQDLYHPVECCLPGGYERWRVAAIAAGGRHSMVLAIPMRETPAPSPGDPTLSGGLGLGLGHGGSSDEYELADGYSEPSLYDKDFAYDPNQLLPEASSPQRPGSASGAAAGAGALGGEGSVVLPDLKPQEGLSEWPTLGGNMSSELDWEVATAHDGGGNSSLSGNSALLPLSAAAAIPVPAAAAAAAATAAAPAAAASPGRVGSLASSHGSGGGAAAIGGRPLSPPPPQQLPPHLHPIATAAAAAAATGNPASATSTASGSVPLPPPAVAVLAASHNSPPGSPAIRHHAATADGGVPSPSRSGSNALPPLPPAPGSAAGSMSAFRRVGSHSGSLAALLPQPAAAVAAIFDSAAAPSSPLAALLPGPAAAAVATMDSDADIARYNAAAAAAAALSAGGSRPGSAHGSIGGGVEGGGGVGSASGMQWRSGFRPVFGGDGDEEDEAMQAAEAAQAAAEVEGDSGDAEDEEQLDDTDEEQVMYETGADPRRSPMQRPRSPSLQPLSPRRHASITAAASIPGRSSPSGLGLGSGPLAGVGSGGVAGGGSGLAGSPAGRQLIQSYGSPRLPSYIGQQQLQMQLQQDGDE